jgi:hypothetical protein
MLLAPATTASSALVVARQVDGDDNDDKSSPISLAVVSLVSGLATGWWRNKRSSRRWHERDISSHRLSPMAAAVTFRCSFLLSRDPQKL